MLINFHLTKFVLKESADVKTKRFLSIKSYKLVQMSLKGKKKTH